MAAVFGLQRASKGLEALFRFLPGDGLKQRTHRLSCGFSFYLSFHECVLFDFVSNVLPYFFFVLYFSFLLYFMLFLFDPFAFCVLF